MVDNITTVVNISVLDGSLLVQYDVQDKQAYLRRSRKRSTVRQEIVVVMERVQGNEQFGKRTVLGSSLRGEVCKSVSKRLEEGGGLVQLISTGCLNRIVGCVAD